MTQNLYTSSRLKVFRECHRKHFYKYVLKIRTPSTEHTEYGTVGHKALEVYYLAWQSGAGRTTRLMAAVGELERHRLSAEDACKLRVFLVAYDECYGDEPWEILAVEQEFQYVLEDARGDALIGGKIDALVRNTETGEVFVLEHKFTSLDASRGSGYWQRLTLDTQVSIYIDGAASLGYVIAGCIYDVIQRSQHELRLATPIDVRRYTQGKGCKGCGGSAGGKAGIVKGRGFYVVKFPGEPDKEIECEGCKGTGWKVDDKGEPQTPHLDKRQRDVDETEEEFEERLVDVIATEIDEWLIRGDVVRLEDELPRRREELYSTIREERLIALTFGDAPPPNHDACRAYGSMCPFFAACSGQADIADTNVFPRSDTAHPELDRVAA